MATNSAVLSFGIDPDLKEALSTAAQRGQRSIATMIEPHGLHYSGRHGVGVPERGAATH